MKIELSDDEALVLYEWLAAQDGPTYKISNEAEQTVLWMIEGILEKEIPTLFGSNYTKELSSARKRIGNMEK